VQSSSFRLISAVISIFLLAVLVTVIIVAIRDNPSTALPLVTATASTAQATGAGSQAMPTAPALSADQIEAVTPTPKGAVAEIAGAPTVSETIVEAESPTPSEEATATRAAGKVTSAISALIQETPLATPSRAAAEETAPAVTSTSAAKAEGTSIVVPDAVTATPQVTPFPSTFDAKKGPNVTIYSNGNFVNGVVSLRSTLWAATNGGVVAWNKSADSYVKFTTLDGLTTGQTLAPVVCPLPGLGILFASPSGIQIFDTQDGSWKTLNSHTSTMRFDDVSALWCSVDDGLLVVGYTRQGIDLFNSQTGTWRYVGEDQGLKVTGIRDIAVVNHGATIWLATANGLVSYSNSEATVYTTDNSKLLDNRIEALAADGAGAIWLTSGSTLFRVDGNEWDTYKATGGDFPAGRLTGLDVSANGSIWIGSDQTQLCHFDPGVGGCVGFYHDQEGMASAPLTSLTIDSDGNVYYTTAGAGISVFDGKSWKQLAISDEVTPGNSIRDIAQAPDGAFWLAGNGGATRYAPDSDTPVQNYSPANSPLPSTNINAILPTENGVWFGAQTATFYDGATWTSYGADQGLTGTNVQAITMDAQKRVWLGTDAGLSIWTGSAFFNLTSSNGLPSEDITALQSDGNAVWIGTRGGGLLRFQDNQLQLFNHSNSKLPGDTVYALARTSNGEVLIATDQGLARYANGELLVYPGLAGKAITAMAAAPNGEIWVDTSLNQLLFFNGLAWKTAPADKLPSLQVNKLLFDDKGTLWIGTQSGVARYQR
jgi:ligand-binding sensor domain-containing protein